MTAVFERIFEMSLMASVVIVVVALIRLCLRKAPRKYAYALWSVAAFRLVCPVSFKAVFSLFRFVRTVEGIQTVQAVTNPVPTVSPGYFDSVSPGYVSSVPPVEFDPDSLVTYPINTPPAAKIPWYATVDWVRVAAIVWLVGLAVLLIYGIISYVRLRRRMDTAVLNGENVWYSDRVQSPFILGFVRPNIYLPFGLTEDQQRYVLAHERYHLKRFDHIVRPLSFLILAVHWFNPLVWLAYYLMGRDMEMSCDEKVLSTEDNIRRAYSTTLLSFAANRRFPAPSPLAFGESGVKGRIKNALNWKKPRTWVTVISIIVCIVVIVVCAANPAAHPYDWTRSLSAEDVEWAELMVNGEEQTERKLSETELEELIVLINGLGKNEMEQPPRQSTWAFPTERMLTICCDGVEYVLNLGPEPMTLNSKDESVEWGSGDPWFISSDALKQFVRQLPAPGEPTQEDPPVPPVDGPSNPVEDLEELWEYEYAVCQVSGSETDYNVIARSLAEQYVKCILNRPDWADGHALDVQVASTEVFDAYYGTDNPNFCFNKLLYVKVTEEQRNYWETGSGLGDMITEGPYAGYYVHGMEVTVRKLVDGNWHITGMGTGGAMVSLPVKLDDATAQQLMELYFLTAGDTRDWRILYYLGETPAAEVRAELNALDAQRRQELTDALLQYVEANPDYVNWKAETAAWANLLAVNGGEVVKALKNAGVDLSRGQILSTEMIDCDAGGTSRGLYLYVLWYVSSGKSETQTCYVVMDHVWEDPDAGQTEQHTLLGILSEKDLQKYNKEEILKQYDNNLHRAAALETYRNYYGI